MVLIGERFPTTFELVLVLVAAVISLVVGIPAQSSQPAYWHSWR